MGTISAKGRRSLTWSMSPRSASFVPSRSILLRTASTGVVTSPRRARIRSSSGVMGSEASMIQRTTSTSLSVPVATRTMYSFRSFGGSWMPGVSMKTTWAFGRWATPVMRLRVVWGLSEIMAIFLWQKRFSSRDLPTLGLPMIATNPDRKPWGGSKTGSITLAPSV